jgi:hypothetical protein
MYDRNFTRRNNNFGNSARRPSGSYNRPQTRRPEAPSSANNKDRRFIEEALREVSEAVDNNTPIDWGKEQKSELKKALFGVFSNQCKQSFKNGIEVGAKRAGQEGNPWNKRQAQAGPEPEETPEEYIADPFAGTDES